MGASNHEPSDTHHQTTTNGVKVNNEQFSRVNGWTLPLHPLQLLAWLVLVYLAVYFYCATAPALIPVIQYPCYAIMSLVLIIHIVVHILAVTVNPADDAVIAKLRQGNRHMGQFDRSVHRHVIEDYHCYICEVNVSSTSKHCSACNKCVTGFDHHCKWLNNCVGSRNYRLFLATLSSACFGGLFVCAFSLLDFAAYFTDSATCNILAPYQATGCQNSDSSITTIVFTNSSTSPSTIPVVHEPAFLLFFSPVPVAAWLTMMMFTAILALAAFFLLGHLLSFHIYLIYKHMSTYDYIIQQREKDDKAAKNQMQSDVPPSSNGTTNKSKHTKSNRILPANEGSDSTLQQQQHPEQEISTVFRNNSPLPPISVVDNTDETSSSPQNKKYLSRRRRQSDENGTGQPPNVGDRPCTASELSIKPIHNLSLLVDNVVTIVSSSSSSSGEQRHVQSSIVDCLSVDNNNQPLSAANADRSNAAVILQMTTTSATYSNVDETQVGRRQSRHETTAAVDIMYPLTKAIKDGLMEPTTTTTRRRKSGSSLTSQFNHREYDGGGDTNDDDDQTLVHGRQQRRRRRHKKKSKTRKLHVVDDNKEAFNNHSETGL